MLTATTKSFIRAFRFSVLIDGFKSSSFSAVSPLVTDDRYGATREGFVSRGKVEGDDDLLNWARSKDWRTINILSHDRDGQELGRNVLPRVRPISYTTEARDSGENEVLIESLNFEYESGLATTTYVER